jgi:hypothetical protein
VVTQREVAGEVIDLGQALFDIVIGAFPNALPADQLDSGELVTEDEIQAAADEFFAALRVLLGLDEEL